VAAHHRGDCGRVGRAARGEEFGELVEVGGSEDAGCRDRQELDVGAGAILEPVDLAATDARR
jgi:hypothetical protein